MHVFGSAHLRSASWTFILTLMAAACDPEPAQQPPLPPPIPGDACTPGEQRCSDDPQERQVCRADGRGWIDQTCPTGSTCNPSTGSCESDSSSCQAGDARCDGLPGTAARSICSDDGSGWISDPCDGDLVCDPASGTCSQPACSPGETRCDGGPADPDRSTCAPDRLSFVGTPCSSDASCVPTDGGSKCVNRICEPGSVSCSPDATAVLGCDDSGTVQEQEASCSPTDACIDGACEPSSAPLGDFVPVDAFQPLELSPGRYAMALVDTDETGDDDLSWPAELTGTVEDAPEPLAARAADAGPRVASGTMELLRGMREAGIEAPLVRIGDPPMVRDLGQRVFNVPDFESGATQVYARTAGLRAAGQHVNLWEDQTTGAPGALIPDEMLSDLLQRLDDAVAPRVTALLGPTTDVDGNGKVDILFTDLLPTSVAAFVHPMGTLFAPGSSALQYDHGEVIYVQGPDDTMACPQLATLIAHELAHLVYFGIRLGPYLQDVSSVPAWIDSDLYASEGLASMAMGWSGQTHVWPMVSALQTPGELSLWRLVGAQAIEEPTANLVSYGLGALVHQYLVDQAGGIKVQGAGSVLVDNGGLAHIEGFVSGQQGWERLAPSDGRDVATWYTDMAAALLATTMQDKLSASAQQDARRRYFPAVKDPVYGGWLGPTLYEEHVFASEGEGPLVRRVAWSQHPAQLKRGGMAFTQFAVGGPGATLALTRASSRAMLVRYAD